MASSNTGVALGPEKESDLYATVIPRVERQNGRSSTSDLGPGMVAIPDEAQLEPSPPSSLLPPLPQRREMSSSSLASPHTKEILPPPPPSTKSDSSLLLRPLPTPPEATQFLPTSCAMALWEVADPKKVTLPQLFRIEGDYNCGAISLDKGETVIVLYKKMVITVQGSNSKGRKLVFFQNSTTTMSPITDKVQHSKHLSPRQLVASKHLPPVVKVQQPFTDGKGNEVPAGGLLFFKSNPNMIKSISRKVRKATIKAKDDKGRNVSIAPDSLTTFSSHPDDIKLYLAEVVHHCQLPVKVLLEGGQDSTDVITLEEAQLQDVLVAQRYGRANDSSHFELTTNARVQLTKVALADKKLEENIYSVVYDSVHKHPLPPQPTATTMGTVHPTTYMESEDDDEDTTGTSSDYATVMEWQLPSQEGSKVSPRVSPPTESNVYSEVLIAPRPQHLSISPSNSSASQLLQAPASSSHLVLETQDTDSERHSPLQPTISQDQHTRGSVLPPLQLLGMQGAASATDSDEEERRKNVKQLKQLGVGDILHLLEAMHLAEYKPAFEREFIDGHTLSSLTARVLLQDLSMTKELHRLRLMEVIEGEKSMTDFMHRN